jgi:hypothetical protein
MLNQQTFLKFVLNICIIHVYDKVLVYSSFINNLLNKIIYKSYLTLIK